MQDAPPQDGASDVRVPLPSIVHRNSSGEVHRTDGPAVIFGDDLSSQRIETERLGALVTELHKHGVLPVAGMMLWVRQGRLHCVGSPAVVSPDGTELWFCNGVRVKSVHWGS